MSKRKQRESGQTLVIVTLSLLVFLAFLALALDGGYTWAMRRKAQTAADAAALAGARRACAENFTWAQSVSLATQYAIAENDATSIDTPIQVKDASDNIVGMEVTAHIVFDTFFAHLIGRPTIDVEATAQARCFPPGEVRGVLPVGWSCRPNVPISIEVTPTAGPSPTPFDSTECDLDPITAEEWTAWKDEPELHISDLYMIMDSNKTDEEVLCLPEPGGLDCDIDDDGKNDVFGAGDRSFLNLDGGAGGLSEIVDWIESKNSPGLRIHSWLPNSQGNKIPAYSAVKDPVTGLIGALVTVPVFDALCFDQSMYDPDCTGLLTHPWISPPISVADKVITGTGATSYAHITAFAGFGITCVKSPGNPKLDCPAWEAFSADAGPGVNSYVAMEGFFVGAFITGSGSTFPGGNIDPNTFVVKLVK